MNLFEAVSYTCVSLKFYLPSSSVVSPSALRQEVSGSNLPCSLFFFQTPLHSNLGLHNTAAIRNGQISQRLSLRLDLGLPNRCRSATPPLDSTRSGFAPTAAEPSLIADRSGSKTSQTIRDCYKPRRTAYINLFPVVAF